MVTLLLTGFSTVQACKCFDPPTVEQAFPSTPVILHGRVIRKDYVTIRQAIAPEVDQSLQIGPADSVRYPAYAEWESVVRVRVEVIQDFKGIIKTDTVTVFTPRSGASCGYSGFEVGKPFIIWAYPQSNYLRSAGQTLGLTENSVIPGTWWTNHCTLTGPAWNWDLEKLADLAAGEEEGDQDE